MNHDEHHPDPPAGIPGPAGDQPDQRPPLNQGPDRTKTYLRVTVVILIVIAVIYLLTNHWLHALDALPYVFVVGLLGMHLFMHGGHGHGHGHGGDNHDK